jgi:hypothetical protein
MKEVNVNKAGIIGMALSGELKPGDQVYSMVNKEAYEIEESTNHQGHWIGVKRIEETDARIHG